MSGYDDMARHLRDALEEGELHEDNSITITPEHYLQLNADFEAWDEADDARLAAAPKQAEQQGVERLLAEFARLHEAARGCEFDLTPADGPIAQLTLFVHENGSAILAALNAPTGAVEKGEAK